MAIPTRTLDAVTRRITSYFRTSFIGFPLGAKKFLGRSARAFALAMWGAQKAVEDVDRDIVPAATNSQDGLTEWVTVLGLPDGQGGYGRRVPEEASGGNATLTGVLGTVYADALLATAEDGSTQVQLSGSVTIPGVSPGYGYVTAKFIALTPGEVGNLPIGTVCTWDSPPAGADVSFTLTAPLSDGLDLEDNPTAFARVQARLQTPPRGGVAEDIREWVGEVAGVVGVYVYPQRSGLGTVDAVVVGGGSGQGRIPSSVVLTNAQRALSTNVVPGSAGAYARLPNMPSNKGRAVVFTVAPSQSRFAFDWDDRATSYSVSSFTVGPPASLVLNTLAPVSLKAAIDAAAANEGDPPRLQVISTGIAVNAPVSVTGWSDSGGQTTLTLDSLPEGFQPPLVGDAVHAYGPIVLAIAQGALALCDSLGPSRVGGFADAITPWQDTLTISGLIGVAVDAIDSDGTPLVLEVEPSNGVTIDGVVADVQGSDSLLGPELLYLSSVTVVQP